jgi:hypothetical protein
LRLLALGGRYAEMWARQQEAAQAQATLERASDESAEAAE